MIFCFLIAVFVSSSLGAWHLDFHYSGPTTPQDVCDDYGGEGAVHEWFKDMMDDDGEGNDTAGKDAQEPPEND